MIRLHGFALSNYFNKAKFALLEKGLPFEEVPTKVAQDADMLEASPLGKIPYIATDQGKFCESQVIMDYIEAVAPSPPLLPKDPYAAAKVRELVTFIELHMELVARQLYREVFFNQGPTPEVIRENASKQLKKSIAAFKKLSKFSPYVAGDSFTMADCAAFVHLPLIGQATKLAYGSDYLADAGIDWKAYVKMIAERPAAARVDADRRDYVKKTQASA